MLASFDGPFCVVGRFTVRELCYAVIIFIYDLGNGDTLLGLMEIRLLCLSDPTFVIGFALIGRTDLIEFILMYELILFADFFELLFALNIFQAHFCNVRAHILFIALYPAFINSRSHLLAAFILR